MSELGPQGMRFFFIREELKAAPSKLRREATEYAAQCKKEALVRLIAHIRQAQRTLPGQGAL